jgi:hypothetical protein
MVTGGSTNPLSVGCTVNTSEGIKLEAAARFENMLEYPKA